MQTRHLIVAIIATFALSVQSSAQGQLKELNTLENGLYGISFLPPSFSYDEEVYIVLPNYASDWDEKSGDFESLTIKDLEGNNVKEIKTPLFTFTSSEYYYPVSCDTVIEFAEWSLDYGYPALNPFTHEYCYCRDLNLYADTLNFYYDYYKDYFEEVPELVFFTTVDGRDAFYVKDRYFDDFYDYDSFGTKYPCSFYAIGDEGYVFYYSSMDYVQTKKNYKYSSTPSETTTSSHNSIVSSSYLDFTSGFTTLSAEYLVSQTLYNDDSNWEYWTPTFSLISYEEHEYRYNYYTDHYDSIRIVRYYPNLKNLSLVNDKGETLLEIPVEQIEGYYDGYDILYDIQYIHTGNKDLIVVDLSYCPISDIHYLHRTTIYSYDRELSAVKAIAITESTRMSVNITDSQVNVSVDNADNSESVSLSDMSGRVVGRMPASHEGASFNTSRMPKGVYNVTLQGKENDENKKILIK